MTILLPTLAVAFAAFCVWLTVRIVNRRERWAKWTLAVTLCLPVLYALAPGPLIWWGFHSGDFELIENLFESAAFRPLMAALNALPEPIGNAYFWYIGLWYPEHFP